MSPREKSESFRWESYNPIYGPWYRLIRTLDGSKTPLLVPGAKASALVQPDMTNSLWWWSASFEVKGRGKKTKHGKAESREEAQRTAQDALDQLRYGTE